MQVGLQKDLNLPHQPAHLYLSLLEGALLFIYKFVPDEVSQVYTICCQVSLSETLLKCLLMTQPH